MGAYPRFYNRRKSMLDSKEVAATKGGEDNRRTRAKTDDLDGKHALELWRDSPEESRRGRANSLGPSQTHRLSLFRWKIEVVRPSNLLM